MEFSARTYTACTHRLRRRHVCRPPRSADGFVVVYLASYLRTQCASKKMQFTRLVKLGARCGVKSTSRVASTVPRKSTVTCGCLERTTYPCLPHSWFYLVYLVYAMSCLSEFDRSLLISLPHRKAWNCSRLERCPGRRPGAVGPRSGRREIVDGSGLVRPAIVQAVSP